MKRLLLLLASLPVLASANAAWGHRYEAVQPEQNPQVHVGESFTMSVEWGEGDWDENGSLIGYGLSQDGTDWTWVSIDWFEDGERSNKRCKVDLSIGEAGTYYYLYKLKKGGEEGFQNGKADWSENAAWHTDSIKSYITVTKRDYEGTVAMPTVASTSATSIALNPVEGYEYAITEAGGGETDALIFQDEVTFSGLLSKTSYDLYQRVKETATHKASALSEKLTEQTETATQLTSPTTPINRIIVNAGGINLTLIPKSKRKATVSLIALSGKTLLSQKYALVAGENTLHLSPVSEGIYILNVKMGNEIFLRKIAMP